MFTFLKILELDIILGMERKATPFERRMTDGRLRRKFNTACRILNRRNFFVYKNEGWIVFNSDK